MLLRSRLFNIGDSGFGGELVYTLGRTLSLQAVNNEHTRRRDSYLERKKTAAFAIPTYFVRLETQIAAAARTLSAENRQHLADEIKNMKSGTPQTPMNAADPS